MGRAIALLLLTFTLSHIFSSVRCSSHSEAPNTAGSPKTDISDFYAFRSYEPGRSAYTTFILNAYPGQIPYGGPNYFSLSDKHYYEIYIDTDGDAKEDITFQFSPGSRMGGPIGDLKELSDANECCRFGQNCADQTVTKNTGLTVNVGGRQVPVALKVLGPIRAGANNDRVLNWYEYYTLTQINGDRTTGTKRKVYQSGSNNTVFYKPFDYAGEKTFPDYDAYAKQYFYNIDLPNCPLPGKVFLGQRKDSFPIALGQIFDTLNLVPLPGFVFECDDNNILKYNNVASFVLEVPTQCIVSPNARGVIGTWSAIRELHHVTPGTAPGIEDEGGHIPGAQVSRLGSPLVNELLIGLGQKNLFSREHPINDTKNGFIEFIQYPSFPEIVNLVYREAVNGLLGQNFSNIAPQVFPRNDLVAALASGVPGLNAPVNGVTAEMLRLNTSVPPVPRERQNYLGVIGTDAAGYPNGRRPGDDVIDITLRVAMGKLCYLGYCDSNLAPIGLAELTDGAPNNALMFDNAFPYVLSPVPGATNAGANKCPAPTTTAAPSPQTTSAPTTTAAPTTRPTPTCPPTPCNCPTPSPTPAPTPASNSVGQTININFADILKRN